MTVRMVLGGLAAIVLVLAVVIGVRTARVSSRQPEPAPAGPAVPAAVDLTAALVQVIHHQDVTEDLHALLARTFPRTLAAAQVERIGGLSLLVTIGPVTPKPVLVYAHLDVVPAPAEGWKFDPFSGTVDADVIYGRGAIDDKGSAVAILAATESLLASGWTPARTVYLALGHDEESGGMAGAAAIAQHLRSKGVTLESILDEGGAVVDSNIPGITQPVAAVAIAEKGVLNLRLCTASAGGHSSTPPRHTAIGTLAAAISKLEGDPPPTSLNPLARQTLTYAAAEMRPLFRAVMSNLWLTAPIIKSEMEKSNVSRALMGTSQAATMIGGGVKENVLPDRACATVNYRLFPGTTSGDIVERARRIVDDPDISIEPEVFVPAPAPSDIDSGPGRLLGGIIRRYFSDAVVVPVVSPGATDSRHFAGMADQVFRFLPVHLSKDDLASTHGINERIRVPALARAYEFYVSYLRAVGARP